MRKILSTIVLTTLTILPLQADLQMTLVDKDGTQIKECIKSYSFSNNLESIAKQNVQVVENISTIESLTNRKYKGKHLYTKLMNIPLPNPTSATHTNPVQVIVSPNEEVEELFIKDSKFIFSTGLIYKAQSIHTDTDNRGFVRVYNKNVQVRSYTNQLESVDVIVEYTKITDVSNNIPNTFKSYIHYIPSSSTTNEVITKDLENKGVIFDKNYVYDSSTDSCISNIN